MKRARVDRILTTLHEKPNNPRKITGEQLEALGRALVEYGDLGGIVFNRRTKHIVGGHQRVATFQAAGEVPVTIERRLPGPDRTGTVAYGYIELFGTRYGYREVDWDMDREDAANIAANQHGGTWDDPKLKEIVTRLATGANRGGFDPAILGFSMAELERLTRPRSNINTDVLPEYEAGKKLQRKWKTARGQTWALGRHILRCGDSRTEPVPGQPFDLLITDPPYGVNYASKVGFTKPRVAKAIEHDDKTPPEMRKFWTEAFTTAAAQLRPGAVYYMTGPSGQQLYELMGALSDAKLPVRQILVWVKNRLVIGRSDYHYRHESIVFGATPTNGQYDERHEHLLYGWAAGAGHNFYGGTKQSTLWEVSNLRTSEHHPTEKPVELFARMIRNSSLENDKIVDNFSGSGTCLIAAESLSRDCFAQEIDTDFVAITLQRWVDSGGDKPKLLPTK